MVESLNNILEHVREEFPDIKGKVEGGYMHHKGGDLKITGEGLDVHVFYVPDRGYELISIEESKEICFGSVGTLYKDEDFVSARIVQILQNKEVTYVD